VKNVQLCGSGFIANSLWSHALDFSSQDFSMSLSSREFIYAHKQNEILPLIQELNDKKIDVIVNVSGPTNIQESFSHLDKYVHEPALQVKKHLNILNLSNRSISYIYMSSASVYGDTPIAADELTELRPESPYALGKANVESLLLNRSGGEKDIGVTILRATSAYNKYLDKRVLWVIKESIQNSKAITLSGSGNETRDFLHTSDLWRYITGTIRNSRELSEIYNVGCGESLTTKKLVEIAKLSMHHEQDFNNLISFSEILRRGDPENMKVNIRKLENLGVSPLISPQAGLADYFA